MDPTTPDPTRAPAKAVGTAFGVVAAAASTHHSENRPCVQDAAMSLVSLGRVSPVDVNPACVSVTSPPPLPPSANNIDANVESSPPLKKSKSGSKYSVKPRDPKRDTGIPLSEMQRLMRVYGPIKCLRNRTPKESGKDLKQDSIKRKFYRWFPDFDTRFERTGEGWFKPKFGHEEEMNYRAEMRKKDQDALVKKRNTKRTSRKAKTDDQDIL
ncbi:hypothetical protein HJC23_004108 [Cyclotella cryptica]|uniref:Uncharacterized protein n=1 Tax=Cyclotella cryptica TaxID=29204 RepID=A0ABD3NGR9_9STRA|eukprot:CCRYP_020968-RA/>CCRYP_020968-RA protein AED:0.13 eAED:-0.12 QI:0/-1/0/1/-1/1/1/0/211